MKTLLFLTHFLSSNINAEVADKQKLLEIDDGVKRATLLLKFMLKDIQMLEIKQEIHQKVHTDIDQQQRDYFLRQQIKVLQDELGQRRPRPGDGIAARTGEQKKWPEEVHEHFEKELDKIMRMNPMAAEYPVAISYAELLVELPWSEYTKDNFDLKRAKKILDKDHYGMEKVKEPDSGVPGSAEAKAGYESAYPLPVWPSGCGENLPRKVRGQGVGAQLCAHVAGRRAR